MLANFYINSFVQVVALVTSVAVPEAVEAVAVAAAERSFALCSLTFMLRDCPLSEPRRFHVMNYARRRTM